MRLSQGVLMRSVLLGCLLLVFAAPAWGNEDVKAFVKGLGEEDRAVLDGFFRSMVETINGFVIYGDKPTALTSYLNTAVCLPSEHKDANVFPKGKALWQRLNVSPHNKEYAFAIFNCNGYCNFIAINRKAFLKAVNGNIALFRYVLGPTLTAETLLQKLLDAKDDFYQVFKDDNVLFGILLGYGTENALLISREEALCCSRASNQKEEFPFLSYLVRVDRPGEFKNQLQRPSFFFSTISEEIEAINKRVASSHHNPPMNPYEIPYFGCVLDSVETQELLATYKNNQKELIAAVQDPDFLEKTLTKFFTTTSGEVEIPVLAINKEPPFAESKEELSRKLADLLMVDVTYIERRSEELCFRSYLEGLEWQDKNKTAPVATNRYDLDWREAYDLEKDLEKSENLQRADDYFTRLTHSSKLSCLIPHGIYYKVLKRGYGVAASSKIKTASFHYSYKIQGSKKPFSVGTIQNENPENFIAGLTHTLIGMKRGEARWVAIHPKYGYGDCTFLVPNSTLIVKVQLLDFKEGDQEVVIAQPHALTIKNIQEMQARFGELKSRQYREKGRELWHVIKQLGDGIDLQAVKASAKEILADEVDCHFKTMEEAYDYSIQLREYLQRQANG